MNLDALLRGVGGFISGAGNAVQHLLAPPPPISPQLPPQAFSPSPPPPPQMSPVSAILSGVHDYFDPTKANFNTPASQSGNFFSSPLGQGLNTFTRTATPIVQDQIQKAANTPLASLTPFTSPIGQLLQQAHMQQPTIGGYIGGQIVNPIKQGLQDYYKPNANLIDKAQGFMGIGQGLFNATPVGLLTSGGIGAMSGVANTLRTQSPLLANLKQSVENPTSFAQQGLGIKNPVASTIIDLLASNPEMLTKNGAGLIAKVKGFAGMAGGMLPEDIQEVSNIMRRNATGYMTPNGMADIEGLDKDKKMVNDLFDLYISKRPEDKSLSFGQKLQALSDQAAYNFRNRTPISMGLVSSSTDTPHTVPEQPLNLESEQTESVPQQGRKTNISSQNPYDLSIPYKRGEIGKLENRINELIGYTNSGEHYAKEAAMRDAYFQNALDEAPPEVVNEIKAIQLRLNKIRGYTNLQYKIDNGNNLNTDESKLIAQESQQQKSEEQPLNVKQKISELETQIMKKDPRPGFITSVQMSGNGMSDEQYLSHLQTTLKRMDSMRTKQKLEGKVTPEVTGQASTSSKSSYDLSIPQNGADRFEQFMSETDAGKPTPPNEPPKTTFNPELQNPKPPRPPNDSGFQSDVAGKNIIDPQKVAYESRFAHNESLMRSQSRTREMSNQADMVLKTPEDNMNFRQALEHPQDMEKYASKSSNPTAFKQLAKSYSDFTDWFLKEAKNAGITMNAVHDYFTHIWDLPEAQAKQVADGMVQDLMGTAKNPKSAFTKERIFASINEGLAKGYKLKNPKVSQDILEYGKSMGNYIAANVLNRKINELRPNGAVPMAQSGTVPYNAEGKIFIQSNVPGNQETFIAPEVQKYMDTYNRSAIADYKVVKAFDFLNQSSKFMKLGLGGFHYFKTTFRAAVADPVHAIPTIARGLVNFVSPEARNATLREAIQNGTIDRMAKAGVTLGNSGEVLGVNATVLDKLNNYNPLHLFNKSLFNGTIDTYKIKVSEALLSKFDPSNPADLVEMRKLGAQINNLFGGLNYEVLGRNKTFQQLLRSVMLAPDFNEGKMRQLALALNLKDWGDAAMFARQTVIGEALVVGAIAMLGQKLTTGKFDTSFNNIVNNVLLNPSIPLPSQFNNPKSGKQQVAELPGSDITDIARSGVASLLEGKPDQAKQDLINFINARGSSGLAILNQIKSGKDYFGQPQSIPGMLASNFMPIPAVQAMKMAQGKETGPTALVNILGGRVKTDPNDPGVQYVKQVQDVGKKFTDPNDITAWNYIHPQTKDADGNSIITKTYYTNPAKFETLLNNTNVFNAEKALQQSQPTHDPMWDLNDQQLRAYMQAYNISKNDPRGDQFTVNELRKQLPPDFFQKQQDYYNSLPSSAFQGNTLPQGPKPTAQVQQELKIFATLPQGTGARTQFINAHPELQQYFQSTEQFANQTRSNMGLPLLPTFAQTQALNMAKSRAASFRRHIRSSMRYQTRKLMQQARRKSYTVKTKSSSRTIISLLKPKKSSFGKPPKAKSNKKLLKTLAHMV